MKRVIFVRGIQGSGKSTWARQWVNEKPEERVRISWDDERKQAGKYWVESREEYIKECSTTKLLIALLKGYDVVIDNMNLSERSTQLFIAIANESKATIEYVDFKTPLEECLRRNDLRTGDDHIDPNVIKATYEKHKWFYEN